MIRNQIHFNGSSDQVTFKRAPLGHMKPTELDLARIVVHKKGLDIDGVNYLCEISYNRNGFYITLFSMYGNQQSVTMHLKYNDKTDYILRYFNNDFNKMARSLRLRDGKIKITRPDDNY